MPVSKPISLLLLVGSFFIHSLSAKAEQVIISEIMYNPAGTKPEYIEIRNISWTPREIAKWKFSNAITYEFPDFNAGSPQDAFLKPLEKIIVSSSDPTTTRNAYGIPVTTRVFGPWSGELSGSGERITLADKNGTPMASVEYKDSGRWPKSPDGAGHSLMLRNENADPDDYRNWQASPVKNVIISYNDIWKHHTPTSDPGTAWRSIGFSDGSWGQGQALLGYESDVLPSPGIRTSVGSNLNPKPTYLFRKTFTYSGTTTGMNYSIDQIVDDGVTYYLNGNLLGSVRHIPGAWDVGPSSAIGNATEELNILSGAATGLVNGTNVLAAEVHNSGPNGSDMVFGARFSLIGSPKVRLSELHFGASGNVDWVELQNFDTASLSTNGLFLATDNDFSDKVALTGNIAGGAFASWVVNFPPENNGTITLYLIDSQNNVINAEPLTHIAGRDSLQAVWPKNPVSKPSWELLRTDAEWYSSTGSTQNAANAPPFTTSIVINEIMSDPISEQDQAEFIELRNITGSPVSLTGWKLKGGVDFDFLAGTNIPANGYLVVGGNKTFLQAIYPTAIIVGDWSGKLGNKRDLIRLLDQYDNLADEVDYREGGDWPNFSTNKGSSLELINPTMDNNRPSAWRASNETAKATFQPYTVTGTYAELFDPESTETLTSWMVPSDYRELHFFSAKDGHFELRNITLQLNGSGGNLLQNVGVVTTNGVGTDGWLCQGNHAQSYMAGGGVFHIIADGHGDNRCNQVEIDCTAITPGNSYTLNFEARWVAGTPVLIAQTWDHSIGKPFHIAVPNQLGTPGADNSRNNSTAPPQVDSVLHSPAVPKSTDDVKVTARVTSVNALTEVKVWHKTDHIDNINSYTSTTMVDNGTGGDALSGDGIYTATISSHKVDKQIVHFYVRAIAAGISCDDPPAGAAQPALWIVDDRILATDLRRQRLIMSEYDRDALRTSIGISPKFNFKYPRPSNHYFNATFIHDEQDVYYICELRKAGSVWGRSFGKDLQRGKWKIPDDRIFRNREKTNYDFDLVYGGSLNGHIVCHLLYEMGYTAANEQEYTYSAINGDDISIRNDNELTDNELLKRSFKDGAEGRLFESSEEWWFKDSYDSKYKTTPWLHKGTDNPVQYHTGFPARTREYEYDYSPLTEMLKVISNPASTREQLQRIADEDAMMMVNAVRGYCGEWDAITENGKNGFLYQRPDNGRWMTLNWDNDGAFGLHAGVPADVVGDIPGWAEYSSKPWNRRYFNYYLTELNNKWGSGSARLNAFLDANENASTAFTVNKTFYTDWFSSRQSDIIAEINKPVGGGPANSYSTAFSVSGSGGSTSAATVNINGNAPSSAYFVSIDNHPEAVFTWVNQTAWTLDGVILKTGANNFFLRMIDFTGLQIGSPVVYSISKTGNAFPIMTLDIDPGSYNVTLGEVLTLNAASSYDPDNNSFTFSWSSTPASGLTLTTPVATPPNSKRQATFNTPGIYSFTVTGTDSLGADTALTREVAVANTEDFASFGSLSLESYWTVSNAENRDSYSPDTWYSLYENPGSLTVKALDTGARPLVYNSPTHPLFLRNLLPSSDSTLLTDVNLTGRKSGSFFTGLYLQTLESGVTTRYAFGLDGGSLISAKRSTGGAFTNISGSLASTGADAKLRIRRTGTQLLFQRRNGGVWSTLFTQNMAAGSTLVKGGLFVSTSLAETVQVAFDYFMLVDPANTPGSVYNSLRITEIMYNPRYPDDVEYIELKNTEASPINLTNVRFEDGITLESIGGTLNPGQIAVITNNTSAFQNQYPGITVLAEWIDSSLNNDGEKITLKDAEGNIIHSFNYNNTSPWPTFANGNGGALEVINTSASYDDPANWRSTGAAPGGGTDTDGDGTPDAWEAKFGTNASDPLSKPKASTSVNGSNQTQISWGGASGQNYRVEYCDSLGNAWQTLSGGNSVAGVNGTISFTDSQLPRPTKRFYRIMGL